MKLRRVVAFAMAAMMTVSMFGCGGNGGEETKPAGGEQTTAAPSGEVDRSQELVVYSNSTSNGQDEWLYKVSKEAGFNLNIVSIDGSALADRLVAEKNNPVCDVVFGLNAVEYERLKAEELLVKYEPEWVDKVDMALGDKDGYYYPVIVQPLMLVYNKDVVTNPPADWTDLVKPEYTGQYNMFKLSGGTAKMILGSLLSRYPDPNGEYGVSEEGWKFIEDLYRNGYYQQDGDDYIGNMVEGTIPMTQLWGAGVVRFQDERGVEFGWMLPEIGEPFVVEQLGIINGCDNVALAEDFINWFGSAEMQKGWSDNAGAIPANEDALAMIDNPAIKELMSKVKVQDVDWAMVSKYINDWAEKVQLEFLD